ncbi:FKBP-type peptidyl-prolyl cis-trans isomerase [Pelistega europaea]|uniref:Peptidyl-prolyl cis-trans isomerase n=1 Tax=Pelistega europaea TaxID=106147 RepID=A0A7Y4P5U9_9BURK|nr:FKBP-type peptidyl-prolyl cis-trans isomerase [Pelistega europaea]NOL50158.1 peptidylprolyl isomerase [Pelistega europaea]
MQKNDSTVDKIVHPNSYLTLNYRISLDSGEGKGSVFIDTYTGKPATLQMGIGQWPESLEKPLLGHQEGESFTYYLKAVDAFGERNPDLIQAVTKKMLAENAGENATFEENDLVEFTAPNGGKFSGLFKRFEDDKAIFDFNHPLAGVDLKIDVSIIGVL